MAPTRRVYISSPRDEYLDKGDPDGPRNGLKWAIIDKIEKSGYEPQVFGTSKITTMATELGSWTAENAQKVMRRCIGAAVLGFETRTASPILGGVTDVPVATEYCQYEGALARAFNLPILAVLETGVEERGFFSRYGGDATFKIPRDRARYEQWLNEGDFARALKIWNAKLARRRDVFLAYSSSAQDLAKQIKDTVEQCGATVYDWEEFGTGRSIFARIEEAADITSGGIFLFTGADLQVDQVQGEIAVPRDNVIFEAGVFARAKGLERILIILEPKTKMLSDLEGLIYSKLPADSPGAGLNEDIRKQIRKFIQDL